MKPTPEDIESVKYFIQEKGDITRWIDWQEKKSSFEEYYPELVAALKAVVVAERTLHAVVENLTVDG